MDVAIIATYRCNARCRMCKTWQSPTKPSKESKPPLQRTLPPDLGRVNITGGEPLIQQDLLQIGATWRRRPSEWRFPRTVGLSLVSTQPGETIPSSPSASESKGRRRPTMPSAACRMVSNAPWKAIAACVPPESRAGTVTDDGCRHSAHQCAGRNIPYHQGVGTYASTVTHANLSRHGGVGSDVHAGADNRDAPALASAGNANRHTIGDVAVRADDGALIQNDGSEMIQVESRADARGMGQTNPGRDFNELAPSVQAKKEWLSRVLQPLATIDRACKPILE